MQGLPHHRPSVDRYRSPVSANTHTTRPPASSGSPASSLAAHAVAPDVMPAMIPWAQYDSGTNVVTYTVEGGGPIYGDPVTAFISVADTNVVIDFLAESNVAYYVQSTVSFMQSWSNVSALIVGDGSTNTTTYPADKSVEYFRVVQP